ncbi:alpha/beta hydrolase family protein [Paracoccus denitrificans]|uniref:alpha/beta hydrolase family protein n=1 Tax=Paracoccus denitrificans TaxID=266 RepID=UPI000CEBF7A7|nr:prolyl oligopeptidase family serine peptidase [Paracoccus denitrificans]
MMTCRTALWALCSLLFVLALPCAVGADALSWSAPADPKTCPVGDTSVWAEYEGGADCIRYFWAGDLDDAPVALVRLYGDRTRHLRSEPEEIPGNTVRDQHDHAARWAVELGMPVVVIARPGTYGSSGDHRRRRSIEEFRAIDAALDRIVERHRIGSVILSGHSGGATAAAALLTFGRKDVACAILTSGAFDLLERARLLREHSGRVPRPGVDLTGVVGPYDPLDHIAGIVPNPDRLILVIGNSRDSVTPFALQREFANALAAAGHNVRLMEHSAIGPRYHDLRGSIGYTATRDCLATGN